MASRQEKIAQVLSRPRQRNNPSRQGSVFAPAPTCDIPVFKDIVLYRNPSVGEPVVVA